MSKSNTLILLCVVLIIIGILALVLCDSCSCACAQCGTEQTLEVIEENPVPAAAPITTAIPTTTPEPTPEPTPTPVVRKKERGINPPPPPQPPANPPVPTTKPSPTPVITPPPAPTATPHVLPIVWLWKQIDLSGSTINKYFIPRQEDDAQLDSDGPNFGVVVCEEMEADTANSGVAPGDVYGWAIVRDTATTSFDIFFTEEDITAETGNDQEVIVETANTDDLETLEAVDPATDFVAAITDGIADVETKVVEDTAGVDVSFGAIVNETFVENP